MPEVYYDSEGNAIELSSKWWKANRDDARQIAAHFHMGEPMFERKVEIIYGAIAGRPKAEVLGMVRWLMKQETMFLDNPHLEEERGPFDAAYWLQNWRKEIDQEHKTREINPLKA